MGRFFEIQSTVHVFGEMAIQGDGNLGRWVNTDINDIENTDLLVVGSVIS